MFDIKKVLFLVGMAGLFAIVLSSCKGMVRTPSCSPVSFKEIAVPILANNLFSKVKEVDTMSLILGVKRTFVVNLFTEETTGATVEASKVILDIIIDEAKKNYPNFEVVGLAGDNAQTADYLIDGFLHYKELTEECSVRSGEKFYSIEANVIERKTGTIAAKSIVWIQNKSAVSAIPLTDLSVERDPKDLKKEISKAEGEITSEETRTRLTELAPLLNDAERAYKNKQYGEAIKLFKQASELSTTQEQVRIYNGLYTSYFKSNQKTKAEESMAKLVAAAVKEDSLTFHILFQAGRSDLDGLYKSEEYEIWLRQIGEYFNKTKQCLQIIGHTSKTGTAEYDLVLSKKRAVLIKEQLKNYYPEAETNTSAIGRGYEKCKSCVPDDDVAAVDRRVEFKIVDCSNVNP